PPKHHPSEHSLRYSHHHHTAAPRHRQHPVRLTLAPSVPPSDSLSVASFPRRSPPTLGCSPEPELLRSIVVFPPLQTPLLPLQFDSPSFLNTPHWSLMAAG